MNKDAQVLLKKAEESLSAAKMLHDQGYHGFAASRIYYTMFYIAEALLVSLGQSYSSHGGVIGAFGREFAKTGKRDSKFHRWIIDAQGIRNVGDYGIGIEISWEQASELVRHAEEFLKLARNYLQKILRLSVP